MKISSQVHTNVLAPKYITDSDTCTIITAIDKKKPVRWNNDKQF